MDVWAGEDVFSLVSGGSSLIGDDEGVEQIAVVAAVIQRDDTVVFVGFFGSTVYICCKAEVGFIRRVLRTGVDSVCRSADILQLMAVSVMIIDPALVGIGRGDIAVFDVVSTLLELVDLVDDLLAQRGDEAHARRASFVRRNSCR